MVSRVNRRTKVNGKRTLIGVRVYRLPVGIRPAEQTITERLPQTITRLPATGGRVKRCGLSMDTERQAGPLLNGKNFSLEDSKWAG